MTQIDGVKLNTLDRNGRAESEEKGLPEKTGAQVNTDPVDLEHGHLQELEVDIDKVVHDGEMKDVEEDTSPYPEVYVYIYSSRIQSLPKRKQRAKKLNPGEQWFRRQVFLQLS